MKLQAAYRLTAFTYYADWVTIPIALAVMWVLFGPVNPEVFVSSAVVGALVWSFLEYAIHRWVFHGVEPFQGQHLLHHSRPADYIGASPLLTGAVFLVLGVILPGVLGTSIGVGLFVGMLLSYAAYIGIHDRYHHGNLVHSRWSWLRHLEATHEWHHCRENANFGVTTPLWDHVFDTYREHSQ